MDWGKKISLNLACTSILYIHKMETNKQTKNAEKKYDEEGREIIAENVNFTIDATIQPLE